MAAQSRWRQRSAQVIQAALARAQAEGKSGAELIAAIDDAYPFGSREHHPYQCWLKERNIALVGLGLAKPHKRQTAQEKRDQETRAKLDAWNSAMEL